MPPVDGSARNDSLAIMKTATVADLRNHFTRLSKWIEEGQPIAITKRGRTFATLSPARKMKAQAAWPDLEARRAKAFPTGVKGKPVSEILDDARGSH